MNRFSAKKLAKIVSTALVVVVALGAALLTVIVPRLTGSVSLTVLTGSMSPTIPAGSVVLVEPLDPSEVEEGDVITFQAEPGESSYITHRVVDIENENGQLSFITKGDANRGADADPVPAGAVRGRVIYHVPHVGRLADTVRSPIGALTLVGVPCTIYILLQARELREQLRQRNGQKSAAAAVLPASDFVPERDVARALLMASAHAGVEGRRELTLLASAFGGSVVDVQGDGIVVMVTGPPHVLDEVETQMRLHHSCDVRRSSVVDFGDHLSESVVGRSPAPPVVNASLFETVRIPHPGSHPISHPMSSLPARLRQASEELRRHTAGTAHTITLDFTERAQAVREGNDDGPVASEAIRPDRGTVDA